ncbi:MULTISPECIES: DUF680 domain-containing protein [unclassified Mesorhizobium]|uniref:DUF680 domain-containing protein n=1 Tax=unclassified Mesorhizobium TaxID=325217 RepID=UPI000F7625F8|nr:MULTISPECIES: DUF680 domain-containing protein [unclassified Mesorhizobium]AZO04706.1 DUF680 domain-containing protein [Mesorhizobium sp. M2A.F.Ca.ET.043.02.1.1]RUW37774.1 DUF680 domain-containing protein [Mesorhizobium sp. M2A.F.Ca.ET.015.02.1.1]RUW77904.1 DUF680 domain-containing protein [Mesorhizobium sp. M2A.F.Ca.ET.067.02.1.1]RVC95090.1 DUF680 domain-containing protein [Mesorhizobium sp. M2A.F.Ca.ET.017.03.2.1]RVD02205.1 DUF680 domain-containing protein [Mesorhizobium sp. M2A.F.Ca.ET.0
MKKIILATAALMAVSSAAFAGSDNYGNSGVNQPAPAVDTTRTSSIGNDSPVYKLLNSSRDGQKSAPQQGSDRDHFGNR